MKRNVNELIGDELDRAVMLALGFTYQRGVPESQQVFAMQDECKRGVWRCAPSGVWACMRCCEEDRPSVDWETGGPIIERERIGIATGPEDANVWVGSLFEPEWKFNRTGPTPLIAAMRCFVASRFGEEVNAEAMQALKEGDDACSMG